MEKDHTKKLTQIEWVNGIKTNYLQKKMELESTKKDLLKNIEIKFIQMLKYHMLHHKVFQMDLKINFFLQLYQKQG